MSNPKYEKEGKYSVYSIKILYPKNVQVRHIG